MWKSWQGAVGGLIVLASLAGMAAPNPSSQPFLDTMLAEARQTCTSPNGGEPLYRSDHRWGLSRVGLKDLFDTLYHSSKRLQEHMYFDQEANDFILPMPLHGQQARVPEQFIKSITRHLEEALKKDYADSIIFSDMGHSHFFVPIEDYQRHLEAGAEEETHEWYEKMLSNPDLLVLYHTAEQVQMTTENGDLKADDYLRWRYYTRNLVGDNRAEGRLFLIKNFEGNFNTVKKLKGYHYWGAGPYISSNKKGCFAYRTEDGVRRFDLNYEGLSIPSDADWGAF